MAWDPGRAEAYLLGLEPFGMRFGLGRMHKLMGALGMPQHRYAHVHVVGTNGKSSTARFTAAILERHGLRTGSYTSPHLRSFSERVEVAERSVGDERLAAALERAALTAEVVERTLDPGDRVTQFEALTAAAYHEFAVRGVEVAVVEAGLGGRYDATNVIPSRVQVLTGVALEHTRWLGETVAEIAEEKLAVVRSHGTLVVGDDLDPAAMAVAERVVAARCARLVRVRQGAAGPPPAAEDVPLRAAGDFQRRNFALAAKAAEAFLGRPLDQVAVRGAAAQTRVAGRLDVVAERPLTVHDGAHNPAGARALAAALPEVTAGRRPLVLVLSVLEDKDAGSMLESLLPLADEIVLTRCANPRAVAPQTLEALALELGARSVEVVTDPLRALARASELAGPAGAVLATGSIYLVADLVTAVDRPGSVLAPGS